LRREYLKLSYKFPCKIVSFAEVLSSENKFTFLYPFLSQRSLLSAKARLVLEQECRLSLFDSIAPWNGCAI